MLHRRNVKNVFKHANERTLTTFNKHDSAIYHEEDSHNMKWTKKKIDIIFQLNVNDAFDNVSHIRLFYNIKKRKMSSKLLKWIKNFLKNKNIILIIKEYTQTKCTTNVNILQNSSFFSILYLFYNANLFKACDDVKLRFNFIEFVDNIKILTYDKFTK